MAEEVVTYQLGANADDLKRALKDAESSISAVASKIEKSLTDAGQRGSRSISESIRASEGGAARAGTSLGTIVGRSIGAAIGTVVGAVLSGAAIRAAVADVVKQANLAQDNRLSTGQVSGLQVAGKQNGVSPDEIEAALSKFTEVSKKAKADAEDFYKALSNIGPSFSKAFETAPTQSERLRIISDALKSTTDEVKKAQLANEAFGSDNERLIAALGGGRDALAQYEQSARALGLVVDDALVAKAQQADRTIAQLSTVIQTNLRAALVELGPVLANIAGSLGQFADAASRAIAAIGGVKFATNNVLRENIGEGERSIEALRARRNAISGQPESFTDRLLGNTRDARAALVDKTIAAEKNARLDALTELSRRGEFSDPRDLRANADTAGAIRAATSRAGVAFAPRPKLTDKGGPSSGGKSDADTAEARLEKYTDALKRQGDVLQAEIETFGKSNAERKAAIELAKAKVDLDKVDDETRARLTEGIKAAVTANEAYRETIDRMKGALDAAKSAAGELSNAFADIVLDGAKAQDVLKNVLKSFLRQAINGGLAGQGSFAGLFGTKESGGIFGGILSGLFGGKFAGGGDLPRGYSLVGENGPEMLRNSGSGIARVYPSGGGSSGVSGGGTVIMNNDFRGAEAGAVAQISNKLNQLEKTFNARVIGATRLQKSRGFA